MFDKPSKLIRRTVSGDVGENPSADMLLRPTDCLYPNVSLLFVSYQLCKCTPLANQLLKLPT
jgi:hypothetical protein